MNVLKKEQGQTKEKETRDYLRFRQEPEQGGCLGSSVNGLET